MKNFPTDLLRTFVTVIDLENCTRAGERVGRSQSAISLQLKRLQDLAGAPLFVGESAGGVLTESGQMIANYARRILALNDEMAMKLARKDLQGRLRIGIPSDYADVMLPQLLQDPAARDGGIGFEVICDISVALFEALRDGRLDVVVAMTVDAPAEGAFIARRERLVWLGRPQALPTDPETPLRVVASPQGCIYRRQMLTALQREGRAFEIVYTTPSSSGLEAAIVSGFGVTAVAASVVPERLSTLVRPKGLPQLGDAVIGVYLAQGEARPAATTLAAILADLMGIAEPRRATA